MGDLCDTVAVADAVVAQEVAVVSDFVDYFECAHLIAILTLLIS